MSFQDKLQKYAELVARLGVNIQKDQELVIRAPIECAEFARAVAESAYKLGAKEVIVHYKDEKLMRMKYLNAPLEVFESYPDWVGESENYYAKRGAAFVMIAATDPEIFKGVDSAKLAASTKAGHIALKPFNDLRDLNKICWNIVSVPTPAWAKKVFPDCDEQTAVEKLWEAIFKAVRIDQPNPVQAWEDHKRTLFTKSQYLNEKQFASLHFKNSLGTDITVGMPENYIFEGGGDITSDGVYYFPNMPTEEVFSMPHKDKVNGTVVSSMPLNYQGTLISEFSLTFKDGVVVDYSAKEGYEALKRLLDTDEGAKMLGEVALVPYKSPISDMGILFYNTLFDENASCHFALGSAYPSCIKDGVGLSKEDLKKRGGNDSITHVDFMFGTSDMKIVATEKDGNEVTIFENGNWAI
ncbi:aminopeptidase [Paludicola sp. MB14-C6]|uniref:aminopeptidase n=1 Tax=Paludihabitans sp. MB14-C6 TaxID=3070656 RepID=UPI0027DB7B89|nr:aminopeptidase [Paludicola sp. MB14-C6]WMJ24143.1 aminopeptidase [Paludicola sp. MB14-C6]